MHLHILADFIPKQPSGQDEKDIEMKVNVITLQFSKLYHFLPQNYLHICYLMQLPDIHKRRYQKKPWTFSLNICTYMYGMQNYKLPYNKLVSIFNATRHRYSSCTLSYLH